jgi:hypothetical protein
MEVMKTIIVGLLHMLLVTGCSTMTPQEKVKSELVSVGAALDHIKQSYILGCVEALRSQGLKNIYPGCRDKGIAHAKTVEDLMFQPTKEPAE